MWNFPHAIFNYSFIAWIPKLELPSSFDVALSRVTPQVKHAAASPPSLCLAVAFIYEPVRCPAAYTLYLTPCLLLPISSHSSVCCLELQLQLLRLFGRFSVCSTLQQCQCSIYIYIALRTTHLRGVLCTQNTVPTIVNSADIYAKCYTFHLKILNYSLITIDILFFI